ncbi:MAG: iron-containing alcohol dehydrogenase [Lachnospiraceae bacterium]|nr:iron-containing alcohol dehydrogenase [Lachnospiraceae bacterium]
MAFLKTLSYQRVVMVTGGRSMIATGIMDRARKMLEDNGSEVKMISGIRKNPSFEEVEEGVKIFREFGPDCVLAVGGGSAMDAAKAMLLFYEFPFLNRDNVVAYKDAGKIPAQRKTALICIPSTSGTASEVTRGTVITDVQQKLKVPIMTDCLRPDIAILDSDITMTMPEKIAAETGMDALTHAIESYINHNLDDFDEALAKAAVAGILKYLPDSCLKQDPLAREKVHNYSCMAGISFANVGLGMVHGIAHSFGAVFDMAHGLTNAVILPYALSFNRRDPAVKEKLEELSYAARCEDIVEEITKLKESLGIPKTFRDAGITEEDYAGNRQLLLAHAMLGATRVNPVPITEDVMDKMLDVCFYGKTIDF